MTLYKICLLVSTILLSPSVLSMSTPTSTRKMSWPFSIFNAPAVLDGSLAGDAGFDPLGFAKDRETLFFLREGEIKHARIAMLAALGWPVSELYHYKLSSFFGNEYVKLGADDKVPSVLNGGLDNVYALFTLGSFFSIGALLEFELKRRRQEVPKSLQNFYEFWNEDGWDSPGNYGFDPLKLGKLLCGDNNQKKLFVQTIEIFNGRMSMLAVVGYTVQETLTGLPVIRETPIFFEPFTNHNVDNSLILL